MPDKVWAWGARICKSGEILRPAAAGAENFGLARRRCEIGGLARRRREIFWNKRAGAAKLSGQARRRREIVCTGAPKEQDSP